MMIATMQRKVGMFVPERNVGLDAIDSSIDAAKATDNDAIVPL